MAAQTMSIVRIAELETVPVDIVTGKDTLWGVLEVGDKVYKFGLKGILEHLDAKDPRVTELKEKVDKLEKIVNDMMLCIDENVVIAE